MDVVAEPAQEVPQRCGRSIVRQHPGQHQHRVAVSPRSLAQQRLEPGQQPELADGPRTLQREEGEGRAAHPIVSHRCRPFHHVEVGATGPRTLDGRV